MTRWRLLACAAAVSLLACPQAAGGMEMQDADLRNIGSRWELFLDDWLIERLRGAELRLNRPTPREVAMVFDKPWEGNVSTYVTVFQDGDLFRMYYRGEHYDYATKQCTHETECYAESKDGIHWTRPDLGLVEFGGSKRNNIVLSGPLSHCFTPFKDQNPNCKPDERYKALAFVSKGLSAFRSADGLRWSLMQPEPVITKGAFDSQNLAFWDAVRGRYVEFHRGARDNIRDIMTSTSSDFIHWTEPQWLNFGDAPREHLYTNAVTPYFRAPHLFLGFPMRLVPMRKKVPEHAFSELCDGVFMTSRDGLNWRRWTEAFVRPGLQRERWWQRNNMTAWGLLLTKSDLPGAPPELSLYSGENYYASEGHCRLRRFTLRQDGFVSVHAPYAGGDFTTRPLIFQGKELVINYSTSAAGSVRVELADRDGKFLSGFSLNDCPDLYGDALEQVVAWKSGSDVSRLAGQVVRVRFLLKDADLFAMRFR